jgi:hypothetical protein
MLSLSTLLRVAARRNAEGKSERVTLTVVVDHTLRAGSFDPEAGADIGLLTAAIASEQGSTRPIALIQVEGFIWHSPSLPEAI